MDTYAIVKINKRQYKVTEGQELLIDFLGDKKPEAQVLFVSVDDKKQVGTPELKANVILKVLGEEKGEKITVQKYKSKSRYRRKIGHRPKFTRIQVGKITP